MNLNQKERYIVKLYKEKFENNTFDEFDVCFFVMFLRSHIDKNKFPYIFDWGDSIAHRERDKGKAYSSLKNVQDNKYETKHNSNKLSGYDGIEEKPWKKESLPGQMFTGLRQISIFQKSDSMVKIISMRILKRKYGLLQEMI